MASPQVVRIGGRELRVILVGAGSERLFAEVEAEVGGERSRWRMEILAPRPGLLLLDGEPLEYRLERKAGARAAFTLHVQGESWPLEILSEAEAALSSAAGRAGPRTGGALPVRAPMPGRLLAVEVAEGESVTVGAGLFIIEAMKMENEIRAPRAGRVRNLRVAGGEAVELDQQLCEIHPEGSPAGADETPADAAGAVAPEGSS